MRIGGGEAQRGEQRGNCLPWLRFFQSGSRQNCSRMAAPKGSGGEVEVEDMVVVVVAGRGWMMRRGRGLFIFNLLNLAVTHE